MLRSAMFQGTIDLASEAEFQLGELRVDPSRLTISCGARSIAVEPRVMMVLLALAQAGGRVVSRSELVDRCWDGRVVGDNAVQRVISRIRHVAATLGGFEIETIPKVGYSVRPVVPASIEVRPGPQAAAGDGAANDAAATGPPAADHAPRVPSSTDASQRVSLLSRRRLIVGLGAVAALAAGATALVARHRGFGNRDAALAQRLIEKAREAALGTGREASTQAIAYLRRATELDPSSAEAWGELALAYQGRLGESPDADLAALAEWTRAAAERALAIDPDYPSAKIALATIAPNFRRWAASERVLRELRSALPEHPALESELGWLLCDVGRWTEAIACFRRTLVREPFSPKNQLRIAWALWGGGRLDETDRMLDSMLRLWPQSRAIWHSRLEFLALTGRTGPALVLLDDPDAQPVVSPDQPPIPREALRVVIAALQSGAAADAERAAALVLEARPSLGTFSVVPFLCALGRLDDAFAMLEGYFFGSAAGPAPGALSRRKTAILFLARNAPLVNDPRFGQLTARLGLDDYWRTTGMRPDAGLVAPARA